MCAVAFLGTICTRRARMWGGTRATAPLHRQLVTPSCRGRRGASATAPRVRAVHRFDENRHRLVFENLAQNGRAALQRCDRAKPRQDLEVVELEQRALAQAGVLPAARHDDGIPRARAGCPLVAPPGRAAPALPMAGALPQLLARVRSHHRCALPLLDFIPNSLKYSVTLFPHETTMQPNPIAGAAPGEGPAHTTAAAAGRRTPAAVSRGPWSHSDAA
jgi:hypothetical protein